MYNIKEIQRRIGVPTNQKKIKEKKEVSNLLLMLFVANDSKLSVRIAVRICIRLLFGIVRNLRKLWLRSWWLRTERNLRRM